MVSARRHPEVPAPPGATLEAVYIPDTPDNLSARQVGCAMDCRGFTRHLTPAEIIRAGPRPRPRTGLRDAPFNIVLMSWGEPLHNYDAVMTSRSGLSRTRKGSRCRRDTWLAVDGGCRARDGEAGARTDGAQTSRCRCTRTTDSSAIVSCRSITSIRSEAFDRHVPAIPGQAKENLNSLRVRAAGWRERHAGGTHADWWRLLPGGREGEGEGLLPLNAAARIPYERQLPDEATSQSLRADARAARSPCVGVKSRQGPSARSVRPAWSEGKEQRGRGSRP